MLLNTQLSDPVVNKTHGAPCSSLAKYLPANICVIWPPLLIKHTEKLVLNNSRQPLLGKTLKTIFSNAKERKFCIWRAAGEAGWSQPAWDTYGWDDTALELGQAQLGTGSQYSRSPGKAFQTAPRFAFHFQDEISALGFLRGAS